MGSRIPEVKRPLGMYLFAAALVGLAFMAFYSVYRLVTVSGADLAQRPEMDTNATLLPDPGPLPDFALTDHNGDAFTPHSLLGHWTFLFFGYTHCPDICPTTLQAMAQVDGLLAEKDDSIQRRFVFISVDPQRDTQARLAEYVPYFNPAFLGVTGTEPQLQALTRPLGIMYLRLKPEGDEPGYAVEHSAAILLTDPQGRLRALSSPPHDAAVLVSDLQKIINLSEAGG